MANEIYPHSIEIAQQNDELDLYRESGRINRECANAIDKAIIACNYELYRYDFKTALKTVADAYGFERMNWVLAISLQQHEYDGRFSSGNKAWARSFSIPEKSIDFFIHTHPAVLDGFVDYVRKAHVEMMTQTVGRYEISHRIADRNRLTWFRDEHGAFALCSGVTEERIRGRFSEIMAKKAERQQKQRGARGNKVER